MELPRIILALTLVSVLAGVLLVARADEERVFFMDLGRPLTHADRRRVARVRWVTLSTLAVGVGAALFGPIALAVSLATLLPFVAIGWLLAELVGAVRSATVPTEPRRFRVPLAEAPRAREFVSLPLQIAHVALIALACAGFFFLRSELPGRVPMHFDALGQPNRWGSPGELWVLAAVMLFDYALLWFIVWGAASERWALPSEKPEEYARFALRRRELLVRLVETLMLAVNGCIAITWLSIAIGSLPGNRGLLPAGIVAALALSVLGTVGSLAYFLGPLVRVQAELKKLGGVTLGTHPDGWRWRGLVYFAPDDPALWIPKRYGIGHTLNFARPGAWVFLGFILLLPVIISVATVFMAR
ncbi:MAG: DUF1648 domain-containing protein [Myxococcales bacterium]|nr:DUF1648 domain-containing protein [Myxococcales bacterium]